MKIAIIPGSENFTFDRFFNGNSVRDNTLAYAAEFKNAAEHRKWSVGTFDRVLLGRGDKVLAINFEDFPEDVLSALDTVDPRNIVAIVREPPGVAPVYYDSDIQKCFGRFYVPKTCREGEPSSYLTFPVSPCGFKDWLPFESKKLLVSITSGKLSHFDGELYTERIRAIRYFQEATPDNFDMFGQGWENGTLGGIFSLHRLFPSYRGTVVSKCETFRKYRFSICYENCDNIDGYVSEKIFDSMKAGCVPIYLGAPDIHNYVPKECFIDRHEFSGYPDLERFICGMDKSLYLKFTEAISGFLDSHSYRERLPKSYAQKLIDLVEDTKNDSKHVPSPEGRRKLLVLAALKKIRKGSLREKLFGLKSFLVVAKITEWDQLIKLILNFTSRKSGIFDFLTWYRIKRIRLYD